MIIFCIITSTSAVGTLWRLPLIITGGHELGIMVYSSCNNVDLMVQSIGNSLTTSCAANDIIYQLVSFSGTSLI